MIGKTNQACGVPPTISELFILFFQIKMNEVPPTMS